MKKQIIILAALLLISVIMVSVYFFQLNNKSNDVSVKVSSTSTPAPVEADPIPVVEADPTPVVEADSSKRITLQGQDGVNAMKVLKNIATVETIGKGPTAGVASINGVIADTTVEHWVWSVNGVLGEGGAGEYITKSSDTIVWALVPLE